MLELWHIIDDTLTQRVGHACCLSIINQPNGPVQSNSSPTTAVLCSTVEYPWLMCVCCLICVDIWWLDVVAQPLCDDVWLSIHGEQIQSIKLCWVWQCQLFTIDWQCVVSHCDLARIDQWYGFQAWWFVTVVWQHVTDSCCLVTDVWQLLSDGTQLMPDCACVLQTNQ